MAGRKEQIDWEAIERDYRLGQLSVRELSRRHEVEPSTITRRAKKEAWVRDLTEEIKQRTRAGMAELAQQTAQQHATESNTALRDGVEVAVETNLRVIRQHQVRIGDNAKRLEYLTTKFDTISDAVADINEIGKAAAAFESIVRAQKTLVALEREALGLDTAAPETPKTQEQVDAELGSLLKKAMNGNRGA